MPGSEKFIEDKPAGAALRESEEHYRAVAEAATDAIITIDSDNPATERIFGYSTEEMIGQPLTMLMPEYLRHLHKAGAAQICSTARKDFSLSLTAALTSACKTAWRANLACLSCRRLRSLMSRAIPVKKRRPSLVNSANESSSGTSLPVLCKPGN